MIKFSVAVALGIAILSSASPAVALCTSYTTLTNGLPADATQVNANFSCAALTQGATIDSPTITGTKTVSGTTTFSGPIVSTSTISPSTTGGIVGTTTGNNANPGSVGEYISATNNSGTSLSNSTYTTITSIILSAGDWDVTGSVEANASGAVMNFFAGGFSTTSGGDPPLGARAQWGLNPDNFIVVGLPTTRFNVSTSTTVYLILSVGFGSGTVTGTGVISARRVR